MFYKTENQRPAEPLTFQPLCLATHTRPEDYLPSEELVQAVNVALMLGQPLLLTGDAGTGKTQLAYHLAWQLGLKDPLKFETKSDSKAKDLFYWFDALSFFHAGQTRQAVNVNALDFLKFNALGLAILLTKQADEIKDLIPAIPDGIKHDTPRRSVVLIDEVDKAARDFPNDILNEIEQLYFNIPELLGVQKIKAEPTLSPIVILTSNSEKHLPEAFLRRCVYHHIEFPSREKLQAIMEKRLPAMREQLAAHYQQSRVDLEKAIDFFLELRALNLGKPPATAEFLNWLMVLYFLVSDDKNPFQNKDLLINSLSCLIKRHDDLEIAKDKATKFLNSRT
ncbi:MAG: MoxR family ATPase [Thiotrichaceae bacterium]|nr:MoxR family ATPase [Thiotrichaceae bacterium]